MLRVIKKKFPVRFISLNLNNSKETCYINISKYEIGKKIKFCQKDVSSNDVKDKDGVYRCKSCLQKK